MMKNELINTKDSINSQNSSSLNSPTGSDKFIVVTDIEIMEAKTGTQIPQIKSKYLDLNIKIK